MCESSRVAASCGKSSCRRRCMSSSSGMARCRCRPTSSGPRATAIASAIRACGRACLTLHVGAATFAPVRTEDLDEHRLHSEHFEIGQPTVEAIESARARGGRVIAVGTTVARALEAAALSDSGLKPAAGDTTLFIRPGYRFRVIDALLTNFHLPQSSLLMLVAAFAGREAVLAAYAHAVAERYRFFSYGDAMLVWPQSPRDGLAVAGGAA